MLPNIKLKVYFGGLINSATKTRSKEEPAAAKAQGEALWDLQRDQALGVRALS